MQLLSLTKPYTNGAEVMQLQQLLKIPADGVFGPQTEEAVAQFQRTHGLEVDGVAGPETWAKLEGKPAPAEPESPPPHGGGRQGLDWSFGRPNIAALKETGKSFACRYLSYPGNSKNLTPAEATWLKDNGLDRVVVFESTATRALAGQAAGAYDARAALAAANACGRPKEGGIFFAVDFDTAGAPERVDAYFEGVASVLGKERTGPYGGFGVVNHLMEGRGFGLGWQTAAWSGGQWCPRAQLQQYAFNQTIGGVGCDLDRSTQADFGQW